MLHAWVLKNMTAVIIYDVVTANADSCMPCSQTVSEAERYCLASQPPPLCNFGRLNGCIRACRVLQTRCQAVPGTDNPGDCWGQILEAFQKSQRCQAGVCVENHIAHIFLRVCASGKEHTWLLCSAVLNAAMRASFGTNVVRHLLGLTRSLFHNWDMPVHGCLNSRNPSFHFAIFGINQGWVILKSGT